MNYILKEDALKEAYRLQFLFEKVLKLSGDGHATDDVNIKNKKFAELYDMAKGVLGYE